MLKRLARDERVDLFDPLNRAPLKQAPSLIRKLKKNFLSINLLILIIKPDLSIAVQQYCLHL
jgi:hypothetical protein